MITPAKFAIVELNSQTNILHNLLHIEYSIKTASENGANVVILPENAFCFGLQHRASAYFEPLKDWCSQAARHYGIYLLAGTLPCPYRPDGKRVEAGKLRQSSLLFDPTGDCIARYDKIHLFKAIVNDSTGSYDEGKTFEAGNQLVTAATEFGNIGLMVCFDIRFAPMAIRLRQLGADILTAPSAFTYQTGKTHWHSLLTARALDSQCFVIGAGQTGEHLIASNNKHMTKATTRTTWGHSQFINANGQKVVADSLAMPNVMLNHDMINDTLPLSHQAKSWLSVDFDTTLVTSDLTDNTGWQNLPTMPTLIFAEFDNATQQLWRQNIALMDCQKFTILDPIV